MHLPPECAGDSIAKAVFRAIPRPSKYRLGIPADLEAVAMRLVAYDREERYRTAVLAAHDLMRCQDIPRDGRGDLVCLLDERFPRSRRQHPTSRPPEQGTPSEVRTLIEPPGPIRAPPWPQLRIQEAGQRRAALRKQARRWRALTWGVLLAVLIAAANALAWWVR
jgi:hypothetical protein